MKEIIARAFEESNKRASFTQVEPLEDMYDVLLY